MAAAVPSIKGSVFSGVVEEVQKLLAGEAVSPREAARWLRPEDFACLDQAISVSSWYDIRSYARMGELLRDVAGEGSNEYLRQQGRQTARRLLDAGLYGQLEYLQRTEVSKAADAKARYEAFGRDLRLLTSLSASILNFSRWTAEPDPERTRRYRIVVSDAADFPEVLCWRSDGFVNEMATRHDDADLWGWDRPTGDRIVFRMIREI
jgi:hypothetical protein